MKSYTSMIHRSLHGQPKRAMLAIVSIFLAVALISATSVLAASLQQTKLNQATALSGDFHGTFNSLSHLQIDRLKQESAVSAVGTSAPLGSYTKQGLDLTIEGFDSTALEQFNFKLLEGRFPENAFEIALEAWALTEIDPQLTLGETVHLPYFLYEVDDRGGWLTSKPVENEFTVVGILADIPAAKVSGVSLGLVSQNTVQALQPADSIRYNAFIQLNESPTGIRPALNRLAKHLGISEDWTSINENVVRVLESSNEATGPVLLLSALVMVASAATIYNIFQISVVERIRNFGMLRAIGATPMQIIVLVLGEALLLCLIAIPFGLIFGVGSAALLARTLTLLQSTIAALYVPTWALVASSLTGLAAALVSALQPALWAARVSPMSAIRSVDGRGKIRLAKPTSLRITSNLKKSGLKRKDLPELAPVQLLSRMANDNLWRNRFRSLVSIFSLGLGVLLTILFGAYASGMNTDSVVQQLLHGSYAIKSASPFSNQGYSEEALKMIKGLPGVTSIIKTRMDDLNYCLVPADRIDPKQREALMKMGSRNPTPAAIAEPGYLPVPSQVFGYDIEMLSSLTAQLIEGSIDPAVLSTGQYAIVVDPEGVFGYHPGDELILEKVVLGIEQEITQTASFKVAAIISEPPVYMGYGLKGPEVLLTEEAFIAYTGSSLYKRFDIMIDDAVVSAEDQVALEERLQQIAQTVEDGSLMSYEEMRQDLEKEKRDMLMLVYGMVSMVTLIGVINIINTLTTNLIVRTREFGTLRAIGMTVDQLKTITRFEGLLYGLFSVVWGGAGGAILVCWLMKMLAEQGPMEQVFPWETIILTSFGGIAISVLATVFPARRISRLTIIEALRMVE